MPLTGALWFTHQQCRCGRRSEGPMLYHSLGPCGLLTSGADVAGGVRGPCYTIDWGPVVYSPAVQMWQEE